MCRDVRGNSPQQIKIQHFYRANLFPYFILPLLLQSSTPEVVHKCRILLLSQDVPPAEKELH